MRNMKLDKVFIAGGYGMIGSAIACQIREHFPSTALVIAGRNPGKGTKLVEQLGFASSAFIDLAGTEVPEQAANAQLIIAAVPDPKNLLAEFAIKNNIAFILGPWCRWAITKRACFCLWSPCLPLIFVPLTA